MKTTIQSMILVSALVMMTGNIAAAASDGENGRSVAQLVSVAQSGGDMLARRAAIKTLGEFGTAEAVSALNSLITLDDPDLRVYVAQSLDRSRSINAIDGLIALTMDSDAAVSDRALAGIRVAQIGRAHV